MAKNLYVGNLSFDTTAGDLETAFGQHGTVSRAQVVSDRETGRSRGFGFVEMGSQDAADAAIRELDGFQMGGRPLAVRVAEERERPARGPGGPRGGGGGFGGPRGGGMPQQVIGEGTGVVKFFNAQKGFGFVVRDDGGEDVFVHISAVERAGLTGLAEGQPLGFTLVDRGGRVSATDLKIEGEPLPVTSGGGGREDRGGAGGPQRQLTGEKASGTVKFFNAMKGFGFIQRDDGQPDAFVHISAVERAGMPTLNEGDRLEFELEVDRRGKYAAVNLTPLQS
jgi:CspA family cold shock protein